jgi:hypothetical protein
VKRREFITLLGGAAAWPQEKQRRTSIMNIRSFIGVACAAVAIATAMPAAAQEGETVAPYFNQAIPNIPGKSLVALVVDYAPGGRVAFAHPRKIGFHLRVRSVWRNRVTGE